MLSCLPLPFLYDYILQLGMIIEGQKSAAILQIPLLNINMPAAEVDKKSPHSPVFEEKSRRDENIVVRT